MLRVLELPGGGRLIVEADEAAGKAPTEVAKILDVPDPDRRTGARPVSKSDRMAKAGQVLQDQVDGLSRLARTVIANGGPSEVTIEAHVKFSGGVDFIPFIANASGEGGLKLTMNWKGGE